jgi:voltage-gated potassium channel
MARFFTAHRHSFDVSVGTMQLGLFLTAMSGVIYVNQVGVNDKMHTFLDALYFTVTTLTTTGYGDITIVGDTGKILVIFTMLVGIGLFLRLVKRIFVRKHNYTACGSCHYARHDMDASHCKRCGEEVDQYTCV